MKEYNSLSSLNNEGFRRHTGVYRKTFEVMTKMLQKAEKKKKVQGGKPNILSIEDRLLMWLEYIREYRTYFHIANSYGISESTCYRNCVWIEDVLIKSKKFSLPGKKELKKSDHKFDVVLIDATETPIERPKKKDAKTEGMLKEDSIQAKRRNTL